MMLIDTHTHMYLEEFDHDKTDVMERASKAGVTRILLPAIDSATHERLFKMEQDYAGIAMAMMGLHPCSVKENFQEELRMAEQLLSTRKFVAVGEIGLDFYWDLSFREQQYEAFRRQIEWALHYNVPISIHSREATDDCIGLVKEYQARGLKGVFHCFSGTANQAQQIVDLGFYLGVGGVLTFKNSGLDKAIKDIDPSHFVLETDAPYLAPVPYRDKRNEAGYLQFIIQKLADVKEMSVEEMAQITSHNAQKLFGL